MEEATDSILYEPSTQNKIDRGWREVLERMKQYFKQQLNQLVEEGEHDPNDKQQTSLTAVKHHPACFQNVDQLHVETIAIITHACDKVPLWF